MEYKKYILISIVFVLIALSPSFAFAQSISINNGLTYLQSTQSPEGYWGEVSEVPYNSFVDTCIVADTLNYLNETGTEYNSAIQWINTSEVFNDDYLFTKMLVLAQVGLDVSTIRDYLLSVINDDSGWGATEGFESDVKRTTLALQALNAINDPDLDTINSALFYLTNNQNTDGGFGFFPENDASAGSAQSSNVYMTALVSMTLQQFSLTTDLATAINKATDYLIAHQNVDGGFGPSTNSGSTIYETALAYIALAGVITDNTVLGNTVNYLLSTQSVNGSWNDDPYSTALALRALHLSENKPPVPPQLTTGTVTGKAVDASTSQPLENVTVISGQLSATTTNTGDFILSDIPEGNQTIEFSLTGYTTSTVTVDITAGSIINLGTIPLSSNPNTGIIKGTVTDADNAQPLEGVTITVTGSFSGSTVTGIDGSFIFTDVTPGSITLTASKTGYNTVTGTATIVAGGILFFNPQLSTQPTTGTVTGKAVDASTSQPLENVTVISGQLSATTTNTGDFILSDIPEGNQTIEFNLTGYATSTVTVDITAGSIINLGTIPLSTSPTAGIIKGTVTDADNAQPLEGVTITVTGSFSGSTVTGADGSFIFTNVTPGSVTLTASKTGYYSITGTGTVAAGGILFFNPQLSTQPPEPTTGNLTGKVFDSATNEPIQSATISLSGGPSTSTDIQGIFLIKDIAPDTYQVTISASGYISQSYQMIIIEGVTTDIQTVYLTPSPETTTVTGKVTDASTGEPIAGADAVVVESVAFGTNLSAKTASDGIYSLKGITLLEFDIKASAAGYDSKTYHLTTTGYGTYTVDLSLNPSQTGELKIVSLTLDSQSYPADTNIYVNATIENSGNKTIPVKIIGQVEDSQGNILDILTPAGPQTYINPLSSIDVVLAGNTYQFVPGNYTLELKVVNPEEEIVLAEAAVVFEIIPSEKVEIVRIISIPQNSHVGATETVTISLLLVNLSNIPVQLSIEHEVKSPGDVLLNSGSETLSAVPDALAQTIILSTFSHTFTEDGEYPIEVKIFSGEELLATATGALSIAPYIRLEPSKTLTPDTVVPDGDKKIKVRIQLQGVRETP